MLHDKIIEISFAPDNFCNEFKNEFSALSIRQLSEDKKTKNRTTSLKVKPSDL